MITRLWFLLHFVSGPWTSIVAALDGGRSNIAVCRRHTGNVEIYVQDLDRMRITSGWPQGVVRALQSNINIYYSPQPAAPHD
jgi:hypothetical protein